MGRDPLISSAILDEKNESIKAPIRKKLSEYLDRAETLKKFLENKSTRTKKMDEGGGTASKTGGGDDDSPEKAKISKSMESMSERVPILPRSRA